MSNWPSTAPKSTDQIGVTHTVRVACTCKHHKGVVGWTVPGNLDRAEPCALLSVALGPFGGFQSATLIEK